MNKKEQLKKTIDKSANWAAGIGVPGSIFPPLDITAMGIVWIKMIISIAKISGHKVNWFFATKLVYSILAGSVLYIGGSKLINALLHAIPGAGNVTAAGANAIFNYVYTNRLGNLLVLQFSDPKFSKSSLMSMAKTIALGVFADISADEIELANSEIGNEIADTSTDNLQPSNFNHQYTQAYSAASSSLALVPHETITGWVNNIMHTSNHPLVPIMNDYSVGNACIHTNSPAWGDELIRYNPNFIDAQYAKYGMSSVIGILAHEVGHSTMGVNPLVSSWTNEINADYFAGSILAKFNIDINGFLCSLSESHLSDTHPDGKTRIYYALKGYLDAGGNVG